MTVSVDIEVARRTDAVTVPTGSIRGLATTEPWVMKVQSGRADRQPVTIGIVSGGQAEVVAGLDAKDQVVPANSAAIKVGQRLRTAPANSAR
jgi:HlyD family secretion protein